jgi:hypothetical protein
MPIFLQTAITMLFSIMLNFFAENIKNIVCQTTGYKLSHNIETLIADKFQTVNQAIMDTSIFLDFYENTLNKAGFEPLNIMESLFSVISTTITLAGYMIILITYNSEGALYGFDVFQYPNQVIFPDIVCSINHYISCLEVHDEVEVFIINVGGGISFINNQNKQNFGKLSESYLHAVNVDIVVLCITNGVDLDDLEFAFQKFQNFGVKYIFLMLSHNAFDSSTLEPVNDLRNCDFFGNFVPFFVKKPRFSTAKPTFFS